MERTGVFCSSGDPRYNITKDHIHHILGGCDVYYGLRCDDKLFEQVLMLLRAVAHRETCFLGVKLIHSSDLCRGQRHHRTMTNAMEGDLPNADRDILEMSVDGGTPSIDNIYGRVRR